MLRSLLFSPSSVPSSDITKGANAEPGKENQGKKGVSRGVYGCEIGLVLAGEQRSGYLAPLVGFHLLDMCLFQALEFVGDDRFPFRVKQRSIFSLLKYRDST